MAPGSPRSRNPGREPGVFLPNRVERPAALVAFLVGAAGFASWALGLPDLGRILPGTVAMVPNTAVAFLLAGAALWLAAGDAAGLRLRASRVAALGAAALGALVLAEYLSGADFGIDQLLFRDPGLLGGDPPGRMAASTALGFLASGTALAIGVRGRPEWLRDALAAVPLFLGFVSLTGYVCGVSSFLWVGHLKGMAVPTAAAFVALACGILIGNSEGTFSKLFRSASSGGVVLRWLLPIVVVVPALFAVGARVGERAGLYPAEFGVAGSAVADTVAGVLILVVFAARLKRKEDEVSAVLEAGANQLRESEDRFKYIFEYSLVGKSITRPDGGMVVNEAFAGMLGYTREEMQRLRFLDITHPGDAAASQRAFDELLSGERESARFVKRYLHRNGSEVWADVRTSLRRGPDGRPLYFVTSVNDITERRALEEQLRQSQKMDAVGQLAGGVAHDFNNLLTVIRGYAEVLSTDLPAGAPEADSVDEILRASDRAAALTKQLLAFSRRQVLEMRVLDVRSAVDGAERMLRRLIGEGIDLVVVQPAAAAFAKADPGQIEQVLVNLALNARDAMPRGGRLSIELSSETVREPLRSAFDSVPAGRYVCVTVEDTGVGMDAGTLSHLFEPFFTTKARGKGTGLGLATAFGIVKQSGGYFEVSSTPGEGSKFRFLLPEVAGALARPTAPAGALPAGTETILLAEDEPAVRELTRRLLERRGYRVLPAGSAAEALAKADAFDGPIHLLLTDLVMPGGSGVELAGELAPKRPGTRILFMSGYSHDVLAQQGLAAPEGRLLLKPFTESGLLLHVREALDALPASPIVLGA